MGFDHLQGLDLEDLEDLQDLEYLQDLEEFQDLDDLDDLQYLQDLKSPVLAPSCPQGPFCSSKFALSVVC